MALDPQTLEAYSTQFHADPVRRISESVLNKVRIGDVTTNPEIVPVRDFKFRLDPPSLPMTNQEKSGRCWIFSFTNLLRHKLVKHYKLDPKFQLSQKYVLFYDRLEKCNTLLEVMYFMAHQGKPTHSLEMSTLRNYFMTDGGTWAFFVNVVKKYGIVPQDLYPDNQQAKATGDLDDLLLQFVEGHGSTIDRLVATPSPTMRADFEALKENALHRCYDTLMSFLGAPPTQVLWRYADAKGAVHEPIKVPTTPLLFYRRFVKPVVDVADFVVLSNDPRNPLDRLYSVELVHNVLESVLVEDASANPDGVIALDKIPTEVYLNVPTKTMRDAVFKSIRENMPAPFAADVAHYMRANESRLDTNMNSLDLLGISPLKPKKELYENMLSAPNHAMLFVACNGKTGDWQVENSWGVIDTEHPYLTMSDDWFEHYVCQVVIHKRYLPARTRLRYNALKKAGKYTYYPFWDIFGGLSRGNGI